MVPWIQGEHMAPIYIFSSFSSLMRKEHQKEAESQKLVNTGRNQAQVSWALGCSCNSVYDIYLSTQESFNGRGWWKQESKEGDEYDGKERGKEGQQRSMQDWKVIF